MSEYLAEMGWELSGRTKRGLVQWRRGDARLLAPDRPEASDYIYRLAEVVDSLADAENRDALSVIADIAVSGVDVVRVRVSESALPGAITLIGGRAILEGLAGLVFGAARETLGVVGRRDGLDRASDYFSRVQFGFEPGSFVFRAFLPTATGLTQVGQLHDEQPGVAMRLAEDAATVGTANAESDEIRALDPVIPASVLRMLRVQEARAFELSFHLARVRGRERFRSTVYFSEELVPILEELSSELPIAVEPVAERALAPEIFAGVTIEGPVVTLQRPDVTLEARVFGRWRRVRVRLDPDSYALAVDAHAQELWVRARGRLTIRPRVSVLDELEAFTFQ